MTPEAEFLAQLAQRPFDRALRLVFSDWLQEQGDIRGEVIALGERGNLSLTERRTVQRIVAKEAAKWLGPLAPLADLPKCRWERGFLSTFCAGRAPAKQWGKVCGDPRWATVTELVLPWYAEPIPLLPVMRHASMREVRRLEGGMELFEALRDSEFPFALETVGAVAFLSEWGALHRLAGVAALEKTRRLDLVTEELATDNLCAEIQRAVAQAGRALRHFDEIRFVPRHGMVESVVHWLLRDARRLDRALPSLSVWAVTWQDVVFELTALGSNRKSHLRIDASAEGASGLGARVAAAVAVLVHLQGLRLNSVNVLLPTGAKLRPQEHDSLRAASRRLGSVKEIAVQVSP